MHTPREEKSSALPPWAILSLSVLSARSIWPLNTQLHHREPLSNCNRRLTGCSPTVQGRLQGRGHYRNPSASRLDRGELKMAVSDPDLLGGAWCWCWPNCRARTRSKQKAVEQPCSLFGPPSLAGTSIYRVVLVLERYLFMAGAEAKKKRKS
jgi:hypothetical protein